MTRPVRARVLVALALALFVVGWCWQLVSRSQGAALLTAPWTVSIALIVLAAVILALAWPIRRRLNAEQGRRIDPFHAMRVLALARAGQLTGACVGGFLAGCVLFFLLLPQAGLRLAASSLTAAGAAIVLVVVSVIAERFCKLPPEDGEVAGSAG